MTPVSFNFKHSSKTGQVKSMVKNTLVDFGLGKGASKRTPTFSGSDRNLEIKIKIQL